MIGEAPKAAEPKPVAVTAEKTSVKDAAKEIVNEGKTAVKELVKTEEIKQDPKW
jgi:hypothetical protein